MPEVTRPARRQRGHIRRRGNSFQVKVYAGVDPLTGGDHYLTESTDTEGKAEKIRTRLLAEVDQRRNARTKATLGTALDAWLKVHEAEESTLRSYDRYARRYIRPALGGVALGKVTAQVLEEFYAELRRCRDRCNGRAAIAHRVDGPHECRTVRHRARKKTHDCQAAGCTILARDVDGARAYLGDAGQVYADEDEAVRLVKATESWSDEQWADAARRSVNRAHKAFDDHEVLLPLRQSWIDIAARTPAQGSASLLGRVKRWVGLAA